MRIVAISGKASSGKDTFAAILAELSVGPFDAVKILPFAEDLKSIASQLWGVDPEYLKTYAGKAALRSKLIQLGGVVREIDPNTWVDIVIRKIKNLPNREGTLAIIPDLRFLNELYRLIAEFGTDVSMVRMSAPVDARMTRMGVDRAEDYVTLGIQVDISERQFDFLEQPAVRFSEAQLPYIQAIKDYAYLVSNADTLEALRGEVEIWTKHPDRFPSKAKALAAMKASYMLAKQIGPEAGLVLASELAP
jgi:hypothetical protein